MLEVLYDILAHVWCYVYFLPRKPPLQVIAFLNRILQPWSIEGTCQTMSLISSLPCAGAGTVYHGKQAKQAQRGQHREIFRCCQNRRC